jgi:predicted GIY-YIG superfamily endonuclease
MLHCRGGYFYTGHTDDLDLRIAQHRSGLIPGFTADHQPVELVWSESFQTRDEAKSMEHRIKGWSRAKKLALIRGDFDAISTLARSKKPAVLSLSKECPSAQRLEEEVQPFDRLRAAE